MATSSLPSASRRSYSAYLAPRRASRALTAALAASCWGVAAGCRAVVKLVCWAVGAAPPGAAAAGWAAAAWAGAAAGGVPAGALARRSLLVLPTDDMKILLVGNATR